MTTVLRAGLLVSVLGALGCGSDDSPATVPADAGAETATAEAMSLKFEARIGAERFSCAKTFKLGRASTPVEPLDFRVYVHDVRLVRADKTEVALELVQDGKWQYQNLALLDFEDKSGTCANGTAETNVVVRAKAVSGPFIGLKMKIGVPFALNHGDTATAPSPLNLSGLFWTWNSGYKFARIDVRPMMALGGDAGADAGSHGAGAFNIHLGSTGCLGDAASGGITSCAKPNRGEIALEGFDPTAKTVLLDLATLVETTDLSTDGGGAAGCMAGEDDPECATLMPRFGIDFATGAPAAAAQHFARAE